LSVRRKLIAVCGESDPMTGLARMAFEVGQGIARQQAVLLCGGLKGVMEHAARGAKDAGGLTIGLLPGGDPAAANPYIDVPIATGLGQARNALIVQAADAVIALGGGVGTLSEIALAVRLGRPVVGIGTWTYSRSGQVEATPASAASPQEALDWVFARLR
jgi:uncharacterized protein (TIGR00725 family)